MENAEPHQDTNNQEVCFTAENQDKRGLALQPGGAPPTDDGSSAANGSPRTAFTPRRRRRSKRISGSTPTTQTQEEQSGSGTDEQLKTGKNYFVKRDDSKWYPAKIIRHRLVENGTMASSGKYEYYVHFKNYDTGLDEWVPRSRIITAKQAAKSQLLSNIVTPNLDNENKKKTGKLKRKRDAIHLAEKSGDEMEPTSTSAKMKGERDAVTIVEQPSGLTDGDGDPSHIGLKRDNAEPGREEREGESQEDDDEPIIVYENVVAREVHVPITMRSKSKRGDSRRGNILNLKLVYERLS